MAKPEHVEILKQGVKAWNNWRAGKRNIDFTGDLSSRDFSSFRLMAAQLGGTNLSFCKLVSADLRDADLSLAKLIGADLQNSVLCGANLRGAIVQLANFTSATLGWTVFGDQDLREAKGLEAVYHAGPSVIGVDTIYRSQGEIPESFLRGAGVPDTLISYAKSLVASPIQFYSCFISYSTSDQPFAERIHADLQANGVRCWFAPHSVQGGKKLYEQIDEAIRIYDRLLLILSPSSMGSEWVKTEIAKARKKELREGKRVLFPIRLCSFEALRDWECVDSDTGKDSAREIREYFIPDFSNWKADHDSYRGAFQRLLRDLRSEEKRATV